MTKKFLHCKPSITLVFIFLFVGFLKIMNNSTESTFDNWDFDNSTLNATSIDLTIIEEVTKRNILQIFKDLGIPLWVVVVLAAGSLSLIIFLIIIGVTYYRNSSARRNIASLSKLHEKKPMVIDPLSGHTIPVVKCEKRPKLLDKSVDVNITSSIVDQKASESSSVKSFLSSPTIKVEPTSMHKRQSNSLYKRNVQIHRLKRHKMPKKLEGMYFQKALDNKFRPKQVLKKSAKKLKLESKRKEKKGKKTADGHESDEDSSSSVD